MVKDYGKNRNVSKNRPRKQPLGLFAVTLVIASLSCYAAGLLTGWFVFRPRVQKVAGKQPPVAAAEGKQPDASLPAPLPPPTGQDTPLTFYQTLPHGAKAVIGSGLNLKKEEISAPKGSAPHPAVQPPVNQPPKSPPPQAAASQEGARSDVEARQSAKTAEKEAAPAASGQKTGSYVVQIASMRERGEADTLKQKLQARGLAAYVVESRLQNNSITYRVRIGKNLTLAEARDLAGAAGKGAVPVPE